MRYLKKKENIWLNVRPGLFWGTKDNQIHTDLFGGIVFFMPPPFFFYVTPGVA